MSKTIKLITDAKAIQATADSIVRRAGTNDNLIQQYLCSEIAHIEEHRNPTRLNAFFAKAKGCGLRVHAMHAFMQKFANITLKECEVTDPVTGKSRKVKEYRVNTKRNSGKQMLEEAMKIHWTKFKVEGEVREFNLEETATQFLARAFKAGLTLQEIHAAIEKVNDQSMRIATTAIAAAAKKGKTLKAGGKIAHSGATKLLMPEDH